MNEGLDVIVKSAAREREYIYETEQSEVVPCVTVWRDGGAAEILCGGGHSSRCAVRREREREEERWREGERDDMQRQDVFQFVLKHDLNCPLQWFATTGP